MQFYGLLHLNEDELSAVNVAIKDFQDQIGVYLANAVNLSMSLKQAGLGFTLLTNRRDFLVEIPGFDKDSLDIQEIEFNTVVPTGTGFYSAHFKLDVIRYLSSLNQDYVGLCDLDMVCINKAPPGFLNNVREKIPMCYDISDHAIPAFGQDVIIRDLEAIHQGVSEGRWTGGEFITGTPDFFGELNAEIEKIYPNYVNNIEKVHHMGDEAITSAALEVMRKRGQYIADAGPLGIVGRYWNGNTLHPQKPFSYFLGCFLLHLPADKRFLAELSTRHPFDLQGFERHYAKWRHSWKTIFNRISRRLKRAISS